MALQSLNIVYKRNESRASDGPNRKWGRLNMTTLVGLEFKPSEDMIRIQAVCEHQRGLLYVVPAERSWVCAPESMPAHALAGFFRELAALKSPAVEDLMKQWGLYFRQLPAPPEDEA